jgi:peptidoglycan/LPS O-acetylase OafA/YrhL
VKRRPGRMWLFFYGRRRRGVPWLLIGVVVGVVVLAITFALPGGPEMWRAVAPVLIGALLVVAIGAAIAAMARPRRR